MRRIDARRKNASPLRLIPILGEPTATIEPGYGSLDDPAFGQDCKSFDVIGSLDDFGFKVGQYFLKGVVEFRPLVGGVGKQLFQEGIHPVQRCKKQCRRRDLEDRPDGRTARLR
jgi:hypothetical protein